MGITSEDVKRSLSNSPQLTFETTGACNLKCEYCGYGKFYSDYDERKSTRLSPQRAKALLDYLGSLWRSELNVSHNQHVYISFYCAEPLVNVTSIKEIISYVEELDCPSRSLTFNRTTNGILLDRYIDYLVEKKVRLLISLDGDRYNTSYRVDHRGMRSITEALNSDSSRRIQRLIIKS